MTTRSPVAPVRGLCVADSVSDAYSDVQRPHRFVYLTGWRKGEISGLAWKQVDHAAHEVRLYDSKNGEGRMVALPERLTRTFGPNSGQSTKGLAPSEPTP